MRKKRLKRKRKKSPRRKKSPQSPKKKNRKRKKNRPNPRRSTTRNRKRKSRTKRRWLSSPLRAWDSSARTRPDWRVVVRRSDGFPAGRSRANQEPRSGSRPYPPGKSLHLRQTV